MKIAVVGSGCAGFSAAYALSKKHQVTLFEKADRPGGHSHTVTVPHSLSDPHGKQVAVDTGFIVYNNLNYPNFLRLLDAIGVETEKSDMSFSACLGDGAYEYAGSTKGMFAQKRNFFRPSHWLMIKDVLRFYREAPSWMDRACSHGLSVGDLLDEGKFSQSFAMRHLLPMAGAIWSTPVSDIRDFPAETFLRFFINHKLFNVDPEKRAGWRTVTGGSRSYVDKFMTLLGERVKLSTPVLKAARDAAGVTLTLGGKNAGTAHFDEVVFASHSDETLAIMGDEANNRERDIISAIRYCPNRAVLHRDKTLMPKRESAWSSWNYLAPFKKSEVEDCTHVALSYWMNRLQNLDTKEPVIVTLNPHREPDPALVHGEFSYDHPLFDRAAIDAQSALRTIQGRDHFWYCGAWTGYGFHEDGVASGLAVARALDCPMPWANEITEMSIAAENATPDIGLASPLKRVAE